MTLDEMTKEWAVKRIESLEAALAAAERAWELDNTISAALIQSKAFLLKTAESRVRQLTELLRSASMAMPEPWPLSRETALAIQEALRGE